MSLQTLDHVSFEDIPLTVVLGLDISASMVGERLEHLRDASRAVLSALKKDDQTALVTFSEVGVAAARLTEDVASVIAALDEVEGDGDTALTDGTYAGITVADTDLGRGLLILFSDGLDTASWLTSAPSSTPRAARTSSSTRCRRARRIPTFCASSHGHRRAPVPDRVHARSARGVFLKALEEFRQRYLLSYTPQRRDRHADFTRSR